MKKTIISILTASLIMGTSTMAFAAENPTTSGENSSTTVTQTTNQTSAAKQFKDTVYKEKMATIVDLRTQTKNALDANKAILDKIKSSLKALNPSSDLKGQVKSGQEKVKNDASQAKTLNQQRSDLRSKLQAAKEAKDTATINSIKAQIKDLDSQITAIKNQSQTDKSAVQPLTTQLKASNDARKQKLQQLQPLIQQNKDLHQKIAQEEADKNKLWESYKAQVKAKDFTSAGNTLQSIIDAKTQIINDIKAKGDVMNQILNMLGAPSTSQQ